MIYLPRDSYNNYQTVDFYTFLVKRIKIIINQQVSRFYSFRHILM